MLAQYLNKSHKNLAYKNAIKTTGNIKKTNTNNKTKKTAAILKNGSQRIMSVFENFTVYYGDGWHVEF